MGTRWDGVSAPRGESYDERWARLVEAGQNVHGEADLVAELLAERRRPRVLDAGCGTGRVAIELARRDVEVVGIDADVRMLDTARAKAPDLTWIEGDLADLPASVDGTFDLALAAGNVMIFLAPGSESAVVDNLVGLLDTGGLLVAGFQPGPGQLALARYDELVAAAGADLACRWSTWDRKPFDGGDYAVSVHMRR